VEIFLVPGKPPLIPIPHQTTCSCSPTCGHAYRAASQREANNSSPSMYIDRESSPFYSLDRESSPASGCVRVCVAFNASCRLLMSAVVYVCACAFLSLSLPCVYSQITCQSRLSLWGAGRSRDIGKGPTTSVKPRLCAPPLWLFLSHVPYPLLPPPSSPPSRRGTPCGLTQHSPPS
jgi:hypothetical protein